MRAHLLLINTYVVGQIRILIHSSFGHGELIFCDNVLIRYFTGKENYYFLIQSRPWSDERKIVPNKS